MRFVVNGIVKDDEPGVYVAFEETAEEPATNMGKTGARERDRAGALPQNRGSARRARLGGE
jgi:hypothetical protein